jgi:hypothetical protein
MSDAGGLPLDSSAESVAARLTMALDQKAHAFAAGEADGSQHARWLVARVRALEADHRAALVIAGDLAERNAALEAEVQQLRRRENVCSAGVTGCIVDHEKDGGWCSDGLGSDA